MSSPTIGVQSIRRAFAVLGALADGPLGVTDVALRSHIPKSTAARMLSALASEGAVEQIPGETRYRLGPHLVALASGLGDARGLVATARPFLIDLAKELGEAAGLSVRDGWTVHYVDQVDSPNPVQVRDWTGTRIPLHAVSSGQIFLAQLPAPMLARYLAEPLERFTPNTLTDAGALLERLRDVRRDGHSWVRDEFALGITSVAAPVADARGELVAAAHVHGPTYRFPTPGTEDSIAASVRAAAARIGDRLRG
jgi:DNA-binding IclR family transcriptional regulator